MSQLYYVDEIINYGGFFAGETVSLVAVPYGSTEPKYDFTIDEDVFDNLSDRHAVKAGMVLSLELKEESKVTAARIMAAGDREVLREAVDEGAPAEKEYRVFAYKCPQCSLWVRGEPDQIDTGTYRCRVCQETFNA